MMRIGEIADFCNISVKALRHYNKIGLFKPEHVDRETGYRYYSEEQVATLHLILNLKDIGFSLCEIASVLGNGLHAEKLLEMLKAKKEEIEVHIRLEKLRLENISDISKSIMEVTGIDKIKTRKETEKYDRKTAKLVTLDSAAGRKTLEEAIWL